MAEKNWDEMDLDEKVEQLHDDIRRIRETINQRRWQIGETVREAVEKAVADLRSTGQAKRDEAPPLGGGV